MRTTGTKWEEQKELLMASLLQLQSVAKRRGVGHPSPDHQGVEKGLTLQDAASKSPHKGMCRNLAELT